MDLSTPPPNDNQSSPNITPVAFGSSEPDTPEPSLKSHKKLFIISGITVALLIFIGAGLSIWSIQNRNAQLARQAKITLEQKAKSAREAKAREGTVNDLTMSIEAELKTIQETNDRTTYSLSDRLKQEAEGASSVGTGNENGL